MAGDRTLTRQALYVRADARCYACGRSDLLLDMRGGRERFAHLDHVVPLVLDGTHTWDNVGLMCEPCNARKRDRHPAELGIVPADVTAQLAPEPS